MMRYIIKFALVASYLLSVNSNVGAQNLVPNGGFELYTTNCDFGIGYYGLESWRYLNCGSSPGLAHACNNAVGNGSGVPHGGLGYQQAHGGDAFIMSVTYFTDSQGGMPDGNPQEYANVDLVQPLEAGQSYCLRFWMNLVDSTSYKTTVFHARVGYGIPSLCTNADTAWDELAQATFDITAVDTAEWTMFEAEFIANGGETNLTLGAFQTVDEIESTFVADHIQLLGALVAAYFIDDVELWACQVGIGEEEQAEQLALFPNPADMYVTVQRSAGDNSLIELYDVVGQLVTPLDWPSAWTTERCVLGTATLPPGRYLLRVSDRLGTATEVPLLIQH